MVIVVEFEDELYFVDVGFGDFVERLILIVDGIISFDGIRIYIVDCYYFYW